jgi:hypothetical protein
MLLKHLYLHCSLFDRYPIAEIYKDCEIARRLLNTDKDLAVAAAVSQRSGRVPRLMSFAAAGKGKRECIERAIEKLKA